MEQFKQFYQEMEEYENNNPVQIINFDPNQSPIFNNSILLKNINDIGNMSDYDIMNFVKLHFSSIMSNAVERKNPSDILAFTNIKLLNSIRSLLLSNQIQIQDIDIIRFNTIAYDYITIPEDSKSIKKDQNIIDTLMNISEIINGFWLPRLRGLGLSKTLSNALIIARFSSIDMKVFVERINLIIINQPKELMTQEMILNIFKILYDVGQEWGRAFTYFMKDIPFIDPRQANYEEIEEVNSTMNLAALELLNELPEPILYSALINYAETYKLMNLIQVRFSMQHLSEDYYRVNEAIRRLRYENACIIP